MADSTSNLTQLTTSQAGKEATVNELFNAASQAMLFARKQSSSGLSFDLFGGRINVDGVPTLISNQTVTLTASTTNYIECTRAGVVSVNTTGFSADKYPIYKVVTGASTVTSYEDHRKWGVKIAVCRLAKSLATDANATLTQQEADNDILDISSAVSLTATRDIVLPLNPRMHTVRNNTTGGQSLRFIGATGTGVTVANGISTVIFCDGTNWYQVAPATDATSIAAAIVAAAAKTTPVDADSLGIVDSAASNVLKKLTFANLWTWIKGKIESIALALTISGGSINGATIGATTPSTGKFTTLNTTGNAVLGDSPNDAHTINGRVGIGGSSIVGVDLAVKRALTGATTIHHIASVGTILSDVTTGVYSFSSNLSTQAASFTLPELRHFWAQQGVIGVGSTITNQYGFVASANLTSGTNNYGFSGRIPAGTNNWNLYMSGTAKNYLYGTTLIGTTIDDGTNKLQVSGSIATSTTIKTGGYTVATLPAGSAGMMTYVTDATAPTWNGALVGGGSVVCPVFHNGTSWVSA